MHFAAVLGFSKYKKKEFWSKYNGQKFHLGQNAMEKT
jgi:hypothetical protein